MEVVCRKPREQRLKLEALHVEDDALDARIVRIVAGMTEDLELQITWVRNVSDARSALIGKTFDLYLVDFRLDNETSWEIVSALGSRGQCPIVLSNISDQEALEFRMDGGDVQFLSKGDVSPKSFDRAVRQSLARRRAGFSPTLAPRGAAIPPADVRSA